MFFFVRLLNHNDQRYIIIETFLMRMSFRLLDEIMTKFMTILMLTKFMTILIITIFMLIDNLNKNIFSVWIIL